MHKMKLSVLKKISDASKIAFKTAPGNNNGKISKNLIRNLYNLVMQKIEIYCFRFYCVVTGDKVKLNASIAELKTKIENKKKAIEQALHNFLQDPLAGVPKDILSLSRCVFFFLLLSIFHFIYIFLYS